MSAGQAPRCAQEVTRADRLDACGRPAAALYAHQEHGTYPVCAAHAREAPRRRVTWL